MVITKAELTKKLIQSITELSKEDAVQLVELFFEEIRAALEAGEDVKLIGFGNFQVRRKKERPGRNPRTGEAAPIKARRVVIFHPSKKLKAKILKNKPFETEK